MILDLSRVWLLHTPAGTGKTSTARVLAGRTSLPLVYVPLEMLVSKWYGESEQNMAKVRGRKLVSACPAVCGPHQGLRFATAG